MAPGVKSKTKRSRPTNLKSQKMTRPLPAHNLQILPSSSNRFSVLAGLNDMETSPDSNISVDKQSKPSPIVVEAKTSLKALQQLFGKDCTYKTTSIGTKIFPITNEKFEFCKKTLMDQKIEFHSFNTKVNRQYTVFFVWTAKS